jgi:hypothetical protein
MLNSKLYRRALKRVQGNTGVLQNPNATRTPTGAAAASREKAPSIYRRVAEAEDVVPTVIPLADEEELERVRRRRAARRAGGRSSTILSDDDSLGG